MKLLLAFLTTVALVKPAAPGNASQATSTPAVTYYSAAELKTIGAELGTSSKHAKFASKNLEKSQGHYTMLAHREGTGSAEVHVHEADLFVVVEGEATIVTGGKVVNPTTEKPGEIRGTSIDGGDRRKLSAGDVIHIPANVPHQLILDSGKQFNYFVMKVSNQ
jgi:mannose-6-phosphate isomerase-like protein (cupin superfamily)